MRTCRAWATLHPVATKHLCIHGHFYQPPRENPWLQRIERQDSAHPFHDWNARIDSECYGANARARMLDAEENVAAIVNNYARISFNMGPTLMSWLQAHSPRSYQAILEADRQSVRALGHGSAMAQVYSHMIMPLASARDQETQAVWGMADFEARYQRKAEGMWLAETGVCLDSLRALARAGVLFTVLAPRQVEAVRPLTPAGSAFVSVTESTLDTTMPYRVELGEGLSIAVFFYDGPLSQAVAFERLLTNGGAFAERLVKGRAPRKDAPHLIHIATDGETYGHHHRFGEMALAYALDRIDKSADLKLTNYAAFLAEFPPTFEARIRENTAWSCAHGVSRWKDDCGCRMRGDSSQAWRAPLRAAFDWLRELSDELFTSMTDVFYDPWRARNQYIKLLLDRRAETSAAFLAAEQRPESSRSRALRALELQHNRMLMYTSCGWFFDDVDGLEPTQLLRYAARAIELYEELTGRTINAEFEARLELARPHGRGVSAAEVYRNVVLPSRVDRAAYALTFAVGSTFGTKVLPCPGLSLVDREFASVRKEELRFAEGAVTVRDEVLQESQRFFFAVLSEGGPHVLGGLRPEQPNAKLSELFLNDDLEALRNELRALPIPITGLKQLPLDERAGVVEEILADAVREAESAYRHVFTSNATLLAELSRTGVRPPRALSAATRVVLEADLLRALRRDPPDARAIRNLLAEASNENIRIDFDSIAFELSSGLCRTSARLESNPLDDTELGRLGDLLSVARRLGTTHVDVSRTQDLTWAVVNEPTSAIGKTVREGGRHGAWRELAKLVRIRLGLGS